MTKVIVLTGPAGAGKNTIAQILAGKKKTCAVVDVDIVRWMYRTPHKAPWAGEEGKAQQLLGVENACLVTNNFLKNNVPVIILDVLTNETAKLYKEKLLNTKIILLMPSYEHKNASRIDRTPSQKTNLISSTNGKKNSASMMKK
jgi:hypothetical protein